MATPTTLPLNVLALTTNQAVNAVPTAYMGWYYRINRDCELSTLGLTFNGSTGAVTGRTPVYDEDVPILAAECEVQVFQDIVRGVVAGADMIVEVQAMSYGLKRLVFALQDASTQPLGQSSYDLQFDQSLALGSFSLACLPAVTWLELAPNGTLSYKAMGFKTGGTSRDEVETFTEVRGDSARCTLTAVRQSVAQAQTGPNGVSNRFLPPEEPSEVTLDFDVQRVWVWSGMLYNTEEQEILVRKSRAIATRKLSRIPPNGFKVYKDVGHG